MTPPPAHPKIYHITHVDNVASFVREGLLVSDATMIARGGPTTPIGMSTIKHRRLTLPVKCHSGDLVGDFVPFYLCPRSIMLYVIHCANHPDLVYRGGQGPIVHLEADLHEVVSWASDAGRRWAFSLSNAGSHYARFRASITDLDQIDWNAVAATDFRDSTISEGKQAEFLIHGTFPWELVRRVGVHSPATQNRVVSAIAASPHQPPVDVMHGWYY